MISCLPDTGCSQAIISTAVAQLIGANIEKDSSIRLLTADGAILKVLGQAKLSISNNNNKSLVEISSLMIVARNAAHPALISWHDMIKLKIIPATFPVTTFFSSSIMMDLQTSVLQQSPDVFRDSITEIPMAGGKVHIHLQPNATPF